MKAITLRLAIVVTVTLAVFLLAQKHSSGAHAGSTPQSKATKSPIPLILQADEGDHLVHRAGPLGGVPFTIKVDGQVGNSEDFFVFAETLAPGQMIPFHRHHNAEEILIFEDPGARVIVGDKSGDANSHSVVFIPRNTWISATNNSRSSIHLLAIFSRHGFETYMRAISAKPGEPLKPLTSRRTDTASRTRPCHVLGQFQKSISTRGGASLSGSGRVVGPTEVEFFCKPVVGEVKRNSICPADEVQAITN